MQTSSQGQNLPLPEGRERAADGPRSQQIAVIRPGANMLFQNLNEVERMLERAQEHTRLGKFTNLE